ncbi:MAG: transporter [Verrucomicrobiaceae bacterium]|nr:transporter [Verrucomicrobiaceae bacterium]
MPVLFHRALPGCLLLVTLLAACVTSPPVDRPAMDLPPNFKEQGPWRPAHPSDTTSRGHWWTIYHDAELNALEEKIEVSNQSLISAAAKAAQARALTQAARSAYFPTLDAGTSSIRARTGQSGSATTTAVTFDLNWEIDLWGRIRNNVSAAQATAEAAGSDMASARLSLQAQLAQSYLALRLVDARKHLLDGEITSYSKSLKLTENRKAAGIVASRDVAQAKTILATTQAESIDTEVERTQLEHAIAVLIGVPPAAFSIPMRADPVSVPAAPHSGTAAWLERRPDIAAAERRVAAANKLIGAARAAYFPALALSAGGGFRGIKDLVSAPSRFWSLGPALAAPLLDGGLRKAQVDQAKGAYDQTVADYRQSVLTGLQQVEDNMAELRILERESTVQAEAVRAARESETVALNEYKAGTADYLNVITAQTEALTNELTALNILNRRLSASVLLIKALGGGW